MSTWRQASIQTRIPILRGAELETGRGFYLGVAPSRKPGAGSISTWRGVASKRARISFQRGTEVESRRGLFFAVSRRAGFRTRILLKRGAELKFGRGFYRGVAPS